MGKGAHHFHPNNPHHLDDPEALEPGVWNYTLDLQAHRGPFYFISEKIGPADGD